MSNTRSKKYQVLNGYRMNILIDIIPDGTCSEISIDVIGWRLKLGRI